MNKYENEYNENKLKNDLNEDRWRSDLEKYNELLEKIITGTIRNNERGYFTTISKRLGFGEGFFNCEYTNKPNKIKKNKYNKK